MTIFPLVGPLAKLAATALEHVNLRKSALSKAEKQDQVRRFEELESSDLQQGELLSELSENVEQMAKAVESHIRETRRMRLLLYAALIVSATSLVLSLVILLK